jgi:hypothetical protein
MIIAENHFEVKKFVSFTELQSAVRVTRFALIVAGRALTAVILAERA